MMKCCLPTDQTNIFWPKILILRNHFQIDNPYAFPKGILYESQISCKFVYLCLADYADDAVYCIESAMFLSSEKYMSFVSFDSRDKRIAITINENQKTK